MIIMSCTVEEISNLLDEKLNVFYLKITSLENKLLERQNQILSHVESRIEVIHNELMNQLHINNCTFDEKIAKINESFKFIQDEINKNSVAINNLKSKSEIKENKEDHLIEALKEQQIFLSRIDKDNRLKRLLISGVDENKSLKDSETVATNDKDKVSLILKAIEINEIVPLRVKRIGNPDHANPGRPRFICMEFQNWDDRNKVKRSGEKLKNIPNLKHIFFKADVSKIERQEYGRLYKEKERLEKAYPGRSILIDYGKLMLDGIEIDRIKTCNLDF